MLVGTASQETGGAKNIRVPVICDPSHLVKFLFLSQAIFILYVVRKEKSITVLSMY